MKQILILLPDDVETPRLILRPYKEGDGIDYYNLLTSNREHLEEEVSELKKLKTVDDAEVFCRELMVAWVARKRFVFVITDKKTNSLIGQIWIEPIKWENRIFEIGYFVNKENEGKGLVTEAVQNSIKFAFEFLEASKVEIHMKSTNTRSEAIPKRLKFTKEARLRNRAMFNNGDITDLLYYGLLREEYNPEGYEFVKNE